MRGCDRNAATVLFLVILRRFRLPHRRGSVAASLVTKATGASVAVTTVTMATVVVNGVGVVATRNAISSQERVRVTVLLDGSVTTVAKVRTGDAAVVTCALCDAPLIIIIIIIIIVINSSKRSYRRHFCVLQVVRLCVLVGIVNVFYSFMLVLFVCTIMNLVYCIKLQN